MTDYTDRLEAARAVAERDGWDPAWIRNRQDVLAVENGCWFDGGAGERVASFFPQFLRHSKGSFRGKPFELIPWEREGIVLPLYGWKRANGLRRFRRAGIIVPKKQGKSTLCAGLGIYHGIADGEGAPEVYLAAYDREQASIVYREARNMLRQSGALRNRIKPIDSQKRMEVPATGGQIVVMSRDAYHAQGQNISCLIFDELHTQKTRDLWDALQYGGAAREQPLMIWISTAGDNQESICYEEYQYLKDLLDPEGDVEDWETFGFVAEAGPEDDWTLPETWHKANPSLGVTISLESFEADFRKAVQKPSDQSSFKRYRLNIWTQSNETFLDMQAWSECVGPIAWQEMPDAFAGRECYGGLDLSTRIDLTAYVLAFASVERVMIDHDGEKVEEEAALVDVVPFFWIPADGMLERERRDRVPYSLWVEQGVVRATPGNAIDYNYVRECIRETQAKFKIKETAYDPWKADHFVQQLQDEDGFTMVEHRQGSASMNTPITELERLVMMRLLRHGGHPLLRRHAGTATVKQGGDGGIRFVKPDRMKTNARIDGVVALAMAVGRALANTVVATSVYEGRGLFVLGGSGDESDSATDRG